MNQLDPSRFYRRYALRLLGILTLAALIGSSATAQTSYRFRDLGTLGGTFGDAQAVNNAGQVVGQASLANGDRHGFYWSSATGMVDMGTLGGSSSFAWAIDNLGDVVGYAADVPGNAHATVWNVGTRTLVTLDSLLSPADAANWSLVVASGINDNRQVIGWGHTLVGGVQVQHGYLLDLSTGALTDLGQMTARSLNSLSTPQVTGSNQGVAYLYAGSLPLVSLSPLYGGYGVNSAGDTVGYLYSAHAAYRSPAGVITDLGTLGGPAASAYSINNASPAMVVGEADARKGVQVVERAFRWVVGSSAKQDLNSLTPNLGKWVLSYARCVSDTGYIACRADNGQYHAFLLTPQ